MFLEIHTDSRRKNAYSYGLFRETFRENGQVRHNGPKLRLLVFGRAVGVCHDLGF